MSSRGSVSEPELYPEPETQPFLLELFNGAANSHHPLSYPEACAWTAAGRHSCGESLAELA